MAFSAGNTPAAICFISHPSISVFICAHLWFQSAIAFRFVLLIVEAGSEDATIDHGAGAHRLSSAAAG
jgi:hypothetical protein